MFPDLKYLEQGFLETLESLVLKISVFVLNLKNNSFLKSWKTRRMFKKMKFLCCDGLMDCHLQLFGRIVWLGKAYPGIWSAWSHDQAKHIWGYDLPGGIWIDLHLFYWHMFVLKKFILTTCLAQQTQRHTDTHLYITNELLAYMHSFKKRKCLTFWYCNSVFWLWILSLADLYITPQDIFGLVVH